MSCEDYVVGEMPRFPAEFRLGRVLTNPTTVKFIHKRPDVDDPIVWTFGVDAEVVQDSTGKFHVDLLVDESGHWTWRYESEGVVYSAVQGDFQVGAENPVG